MDLIDFVRSLEASSVLQYRVSQAESPEPILALAAEMGYTITRVELRAASRDLAANFWPWAAKGHAWRRAFFAQSSG
jgi:hypothetical protein